MKTETWIRFYIYLCKHEIVGLGSVSRFIRSNRCNLQFIVRKGGRAAMSSVKWPPEPPHPKLSTQCVLQLSTVHAPIENRVLSQSVMMRRITSKPRETISVTLTTYPSLCHSVSARRILIFACCFYFLFSFLPTKNQNIFLLSRIHNSLKNRLIHKFQMLIHSITN